MFQEDQNSQAAYSTIFKLIKVAGLWYRLPYSCDNKRPFENKHGSKIFENKHAQNIETLFLRYNCLFVYLLVPALHMNIYIS